MKNQKKIRKNQSNINEQSTIDRVQTTKDDQLTLD